MTLFRERDIRGLIRDMLEQTGAFDGAYLSGLPEDRGERAGDGRAVSIEPSETRQACPWDDADGDPIMTCQVALTILARDDDPRARDDLAELLLNIAANALWRSNLGGAAIASRTQIRSWTWLPPQAPERRIKAVLEYQYLVDGLTGLNTAE
ncbi:hypothetical protein OJF2_72520 [Aquisphaera giovannonii]|uniref:Uncharacterized protein n=1 Tax=Aquisphaera giovannonii TaxID=406548 RepID=A0A5B9WDF7_9BACT|nr:hypothetical protein [Aquisphaera giovannonii]QEH38646.1 hypothetical protein OJF2_72520 [Aquisphaera giovannonii]